MRFNYQRATSLARATATKAGNEMVCLGGRNVWGSAVAVPTRNDTTTGYRFAVTRWRSEVNSNCRYRFLNNQTKT